MCTSVCVCSLCVVVAIAIAIDVTSTHFKYVPLLRLARMPREFNFYLDEKKIARTTEVATVFFVCCVHVFECVCSNFVFDSSKTANGGI